MKILYTCLKTRRGEERRGEERRGEERRGEGGREGGKEGREEGREGGREGERICLREREMTENLDSIERHNDWAQVEHIYRIPAAGKLLKIRFKSQQMAQNALDKGLIILHQSILKWNLEKEILH